MTTEDDFQAALDLHPDDWQTRLVFADWLEERGDPRAEGYRALGHEQAYPIFDVRDGATVWFRKSSHGGAWPNHCYLEDDWMDRMAEVFHHWINYWTRREAEDAAARAFAKLPESRRAELLQQPVLL